MKDIKKIANEKGLDSDVLDYVNEIWQDDVRLVCTDVWNHFRSNPGFWEKYRLAFPATPGLDSEIVELATEIRKIILDISDSRNFCIAMSEQLVSDPYFWAKYWHAIKENR